MKYKKKVQGEKMWGWDFNVAVEIRELRCFYLMLDVMFDANEFITFFSCIFPTATVTVLTIHYISADKKWERERERKSGDKNLTWWKTEAGGSVEFEMNSFTTCIIMLSMS